MHDLLQGTEELAVLFVVLGRAVQGGWENDVNAIVGASTEHSIGIVLVVALEQVLGGGNLVLGNGRHVGIGVGIEEIG